jgi:hypothetical protein
MMRRDIMIATKTALALAVVLGTAAPQIAAASAACTVKAHIVHRVVHHRAHRAVAVAAYREDARTTATRTIVETRYIPEPAPGPVVVEPAPVYYGGYAPYPVYYHHVYYHHYGYGPYYHHVVYGGPVVIFRHHHW